MQRKPQRRRQPTTRLGRLLRPVTLAAALAVTAGCRAETAEEQATDVREAQGETAEEQKDVQKAEAELEEAREALREESRDLERAQERTKEESAELAERLRRDSLARRAAATPSRTP